jgi:hypothetical protein
MRKTLIGTALALFVFAPAVALADCEFHNQAAAMASSKPVGKADLAQAQAATKATTPVVAKAPAARHVKQAGDKAKTSPSKTEDSTVVAKNN